MQFDWIFIDLQERETKFGVLPAKEEEEEEDIQRIDSCVFVHRMKRKKKKEKFVRFHWISAVELRINRTRIAKIARRAKIIKLPKRLFNHDVRVELAAFSDVEIAPCSSSVRLETGGLVRLVCCCFSARSFSVCRISSAMSGNSSQKIGSSTLNAKES